VPDQLFTYYIKKLFVIASVNSGSWGVMVIRLETETWEIGKGDNTREVGKGEVGKQAWGLLGFVPLCVLVCISAAVVGGGCIRDCREQ
jgi:hypothetical protein